MIQSKNEIFRWIQISAQSESLDTELDDDWQSWVSKPCIESCLAPRQARAALEIIGHLVNHGYEVKNILFELINIPKFKKIIVCEDTKKIEKSSKKTIKDLHDLSMEINDFINDRYFGN